MSSAIIPSVVSLVFELEFPDLVTDLPAVPGSPQIRQQTSNLVLLTWRSDARSNASNGDGRDVRYLVEERHLVGPRYLESRLSSWTVCHVSTKPHAALRGRLKTGHWYQFRVAAVNGNGSRGYSQPSRPFKTKGERISAHGNSGQGFAWVLGKACGKYFSLSLSLTAVSIMIARCAIALNLRGDA